MSPFTPYAVHVAIIVCTHNCVYVHCTCLHSNQGFLLNLSDDAARTLPPGREHPLSSLEVAKLTVAVYPRNFAEDMAAHVSLQLRELTLTVHVHYIYPTCTICWSTCVCTIYYGDLHCTVYTGLLVGRVGEGGRGGRGTERAGLGSRCRVGGSIGEDRDRGKGEKDAVLIQEVVKI